MNGIFKGRRKSIILTGIICIVAISVFLLKNPLFEKLVRHADSILIDAEPKTFDVAVSQAIIKQTEGYKSGEFAAEGHVILRTDEKNGVITVYTMASYGWFGFENGIFTKISGSGNIPTVINFSRNKNGEFTLKEYKEPEDGTLYNSSIKKMFPKELLDKLRSDYPEIVSQQETQAGDYLKSKGINAEVSINHVSRVPLNIDVQASNKLFAEMTKQDVFLNNCPTWIGTRVIIENGQKYTYQTIQSKSQDQRDLVIFKKYDNDGIIIEERRYEIAGHEPRLLD